MPRFTIKGVDKESGYDTEIVIHADSEANARVKAALKGIVVTSVETDASDHSAAAGHPRGSTQRPLENLLKGTQPRKNKKKQLKIFVRWALIIAGAVTLAIVVGLVITFLDDGAKPLDSHAIDEFDKVWTAINENEFSKALSLLTTFRSDVQDGSYYWYTTGYLHGKMGNHDLAISAYKSAIAIKPVYLEAYYNMGNAQRALGRHAEALSAYKSAIVLKPDYYKTYFNMGLTLDDLGRREEAISAYKSVVSIKPDDANAYVLMSALLMKLDRYEEAISAFKSAIAITPDDADAYMLMCASLGKLGRHSEAISAYKSAIAIKPYDASTYLFMGIALDNLGRHTEAITAFRQAASLDPDGNDGQRAREMIRILSER